MNLFYLIIHRYIKSNFPSYGIVCSKSVNFNDGIEYMLFELLIIVMLDGFFGVGDGGGGGAGLV
jgi:hypothetical protein